MNQILSRLGIPRGSKIRIAGNAVKFTDDGTVTLRARTRVMPSDAVGLRLDVEDTGSGIPGDCLSTIFEPFFQAGVSRNPREGTGLGLAIAKSFVELMGGTVTVENRPESGSLFVVELQLESAAADTVAGMDETSAPVAGLAAGQPEWRVLVVDDDEDNLLLSRAELSRVGFAIREARNGEEAIATFVDWSPQFIWMDMRMPGMDGYETTRRIRALPGGDTVRIVALTAHSFKDQQEGILAAGCDAVLHKPYQESALFDMMARHLGVKFTYEEAVEAASPLLSLSPEEIAKLSPDLIERMREAALNSHMGTMQDLIDQLPEDQADLAAGLRHLVDEFEWDRLEALLGKPDD